MRITGGNARSRKLFSPKSSGNNLIRPTSDRVREALFSILGEAVAGARVLDLFAGTGSFGLDALSRGAEKIVFVDNAASSLQIVCKNLEACFTRPNAEVLQLDLRKSSSYTAIGNRFQPDPAFDLIFLDPPYEKKLAETSLTMLEKTGLVAAEGLVIAEERWNVTLPESLNTLHLHLHRRYGETGIWIYKHKTA